MSIKKVREEEGCGRTPKRAAEDMSQEELVDFVVGLQRILFVDYLTPEECEEDEDCEGGFWNVDMPNKVDMDLVADHFADVDLAPDRGSVAS